MRQGWITTVGVVVGLLVGGLPVERASASPPMPLGGGATVTDAWRATATASADDTELAGDATVDGRIDARLRRFTSFGDPVTVEVTGDDAAIRAAVRRVGGTLGRGGGGLWLATVPGNRLLGLSSATGVGAVRAPERLDNREQREPRAERGPYSAVGEDGVKYWHQAGYTGAGVKVGIIGLFDPTVLQTEITNGEIPNVPAQNRTCITAGAPCPFGTPGQTWGNSLAELVADGAPGATLYLAELGTRTDHYAIIDWMAANGVTILVNPNLWTYDGPGNGTGPSAAIVDYAVSKGIAWFNLAGEMGGSVYAYYGGSYWRGSWSDGDSDRWLNFSGTDESLSAYCGYLLGLRWSDWGSVRTDYDLYISDYNISTRGNGTKKLLSGTVQSPSVAPLEGTMGAALCNTNPAYGTVYDTNKDGFVSLWVQRKSTSPASGATGDILEIGVAYGWIEHWSIAGSAAVAFADSANPGAVTVGGKSITSGYGGLRHGSVGPTNDGRRKPDVTYTPCLTTSVDGVADYNNCNTGFYGSDGAAAFVAGLAAVVKQAIGIPSAAALARYLRDNSDDPDTSSMWPQVDGGGHVRITDSPPPSSFPKGEFVAWSSPMRLVDTRYGLGAPGKLNAGQTLHLYLPNMPPDYPYAHVLNIVLVNPTANGWLEAYPHGWSYPGRSSILNTDAGKNMANVVVIPDNQTRIDIVSSGGGDIIVDYVGGFKQVAAEGYASATQGAGRFHPLDPFRLVDSRACTGLPGCSGQPVAAQSFTDIQFGGAADPSDPLNAIPANAMAVAFSLTVDSPAAKGYASVVPGGASTITTSSLNFDANGTATNLVLTRLDANGVARVFVSQSAHLQVDVLGWFTSATGAADDAGTFVAITPSRALDTRQPPHTKPAAGVSVDVDVAAVGVPDTAIAALVNNVSVASAASGQVTAAATPPADPLAYRNLFVATAGRPIAAATISGTDSGSMTLTPSMSTHLVADVWGYFRPPSTAPAPPGSVSLISHAPDGSPADAPAYLRVMSRSGEAAIFQSTASNLDPTPTGSDTFLWRALDDSVIELPVSSSEIVVSGDGNTVAFTTTFALLPEDSQYASNSVYVYHADTDTLDYVPTPYTLDYQVRLQITDDGRHVWYNTIYGANAPHALRYDTTTETLDEPLGDHAPGIAILPDGSGYVSYTTNPTCTATRITYSPATSTPLPGFFCGSQLDYTVDAAWMVWAPFNYAVPSRTNSLTGAVTTFNSCGLYTSAFAITDDGQSVLLKAAACRLGVVDWAAGTLTPVDRTYDGRVPGGSITAGDMSGDGKFVVYSTNATNILETPAPAGGVYRVDVTAL